MNAAEILQKLKSFITPQNLIIILAVSTFAPFIFTAIALILTVLIILLTPDFQRGLFAFKGSFFIMFFCGYAFIVAFFNQNLYGIFAAPVCFFILTIFCFVRRFSTREAIDSGLTASLFMVYPAVATAIFEALTNESTSSLIYRCTSYFFNANYFGAMMAAAVIICAYRLIEQKGKGFFYYPTALFALIGVYLSGSLFAIVEIIVGIAIYLLLSKHYRLFCLMIMLGSLALILISLVPSLLPRLAEAATTTGYRIRIWGVAIREIGNHPLFGRGFLSYNEVNPLYEGSYQTEHCHNLFIDAMLNFGIIGTLLLGVMFYFIIKVVFLCFKKERNELTILIISVITAVLSHCFTDITYFWIQTGAFYAILLGSIGCEERRLGIESELILKSRIF